MPKNERLLCDAIISLELGNAIRSEKTAKKAAGMLFEEALSVVCTPFEMNDKTYGKSGKYGKRLAEKIGICLRIAEDMAKTGLAPDKAIESARKLILEINDANTPKNWKDKRTGCQLQFAMTLANIGQIEEAVKIARDYPFYNASGSDLDAIEAFCQIAKATHKAGKSPALIAKMIAKAEKTRADRFDGGYGHILNIEICLADTLLEVGMDANEHLTTLKKMAVEPYGWMDEKLLPAAIDLEMRMGLFSDTLHTAKGILKLGRENDYANALRKIGSAIHKMAAEGEER